jgi:hypothetical protein
MIYSTEALRGTNRNAEEYTILWLQNINRRESPLNVLNVFSPNVDAEIDSRIHRVPCHPLLSCKQKVKETLTTWSIRSSSHRQCIPIRHCQTLAFLCEMETVWSVTHFPTPSLTSRLLIQARSSMSIWWDSHSSYSTPRKLLKICSFVGHLNILTGRIFWLLEII